MERPLVSVVVPCFNHARFVEECLRSIMAQTYPTLELVVVDDGSTDGSAEIVGRLLRSEEAGRRFAEGGIVLEVLGRNSGPHAALNLGIGRASGEVVAICNSDDRFRPRRVEVLARALAAARASLAFGAVRIIDRWGDDVTETDWLALRLSHMQRSIGAHPSVGFALLTGNVALSTGNLVFRRDLFERIGGFRPLRYCHDWDFVMRSLLVDEPVFVRRILYEYRLHGSNSFRSLEEVAGEDGPFLLRSFFSAVQREEYDNPLVPGPRTWPGVFDAVMDLTDLRSHWQAARRSPA